jgi:hypothetical protein
MTIAEKRFKAEKMEHFTFLGNLSIPDNTLLALFF